MQDNSPLAQALRIDTPSIGQSFGMGMAGSQQAPVSAAPVASVNSPVAAQQPAVAPLGISLAQRLMSDDGKTMNNFGAQTAMDIMGSALLGRQSETPYIKNIKVGGKRVGDK